jgi:hypothetical protein
MDTVVSSPKILFVSEILPEEGAFGGELRCLQVLRSLQEMGTVEILFLGGHAAAAQSKSLKIRHTVEVTPQSNRGFIEKLRWTLDPKADYPYGYGTATGALREVRQTLEGFDLIWFSKLRSSELFPNSRWPRSVLDIDDLPSKYEESAVQNEKQPLRRLMALRAQFSWRRREKLLGDRFSVIATCSEEDKQYLQHLGTTAPIHVVPNGFERPNHEPVRRMSKPPRLGFVGLCDFYPNRNGISWFVSECWSRIKAEIPDARLRLVGRDSDGFLNSFGPDVDKLGWLPGVSEEMQTWSAMIVPIRVGAGTRVKIAHAFSQKCPVVSTALGAYGYGAQSGDEMYLADTPEEFADACIAAIRNPNAAAEMAERAWRQFLEKWTWDAIRPRVWAAAEDALRLSRMPEVVGAV